MRCGVDLVEDVVQQAASDVLPLRCCVRSNCASFSAMRKVFCCPWLNHTASSGSPVDGGTPVRPCGCRRWCGRRARSRSQAGGRSRSRMAVDGQRRLLCTPGSTCSGPAADACYSGCSTKGTSCCMKGGPHLACTVLHRAGSVARPKGSTASQRTARPAPRSVSACSVALGHGRGCSATAQRGNRGRTGRSGRPGTAAGPR
jgi:hypothetical protein